MGKVKAKFICEKCAEYKCRQNLHQHQLSSVKKITFDCETCGKSCNRKDNLRHKKKYRKQKTEEMCPMWNNFQQNF